MSKGISLLGNYSIAVEGNKIPMSYYEINSADNELE